MWQLPEICFYFCRIFASCGFGRLGVACWPVASSRVQTRPKLSDL